MNGLAKYFLLLFLLILPGANSAYAANCDYRVIADWGTGFTAQVVITNNTSEVINDWSVSWVYTDGSSVAHLWNAELTAGASYIASSWAYNARIEPNREVSFGFNGNKSSAGGSAEVPVLGGICSDASPINQAPVSEIIANPTQGTAPLNVIFDATASVDPENDNLSYLWDFGDGETSTDEIVTHTFTEEGTYSVSLIVSDGQLESTASFEQIVVSEPESNDADDAGDAGDAGDAEGSNAAYLLDKGDSSLYFVSTKNTHVVETHNFLSLDGSINNAGLAELTIDLTSVETGVSIRNERLQEHLFEVENSNFGVATLPVDLQELDSLQVGGSITEDALTSLDLHGTNAVFSANLVITKLSNSRIMVQNSSPILIDAEDYDLVGGIETLRNIANLSSIGYTVPVNFTLIFNRQL